MVSSYLSTLDRRTSDIIRDLAIGARVRGYYLQAWKRAFLLYCCSFTCCKRFGVLPDEKTKKDRLHKRKLLRVKKRQAYVRMKQKSEEQQIEDEASLIRKMNTLSLHDTQHNYEKEQEQETVLLQHWNIAHLKMKDAIKQHQLTLLQNEQQLLQATDPTQAAALLNENNVASTHLGKSKDMDKLLGRGVDNKNQKKLLYHASHHASKTKTDTSIHNNNNNNSSNTNNSNSSGSHDDSGRVSAVKQKRRKKRHFPIVTLTARQMQAYLDDYTIKLFDSDNPSDADNFTDLENDEYEGTVNTPHTTNILYRKNITFAFQVIRLVLISHPFFISFFMLLSFSFFAAHSILLLSHDT